MIYVHARYTLLQGNRRKKNVVLQENSTNTHANAKHDTQTQSDTLCDAFYTRYRAAQRLGRHNSSGSATGSRRCTSSDGVCRSRDSVQRRSDVERRVAVRVVKVEKDVIGVSAPKLSTVINVVTNGASSSLGVGLVEFVLVWNKHLDGAERISLAMPYQCEFT